MSVVRVLNKRLSLVKLLGLTSGFVIFLCILLYVNYEFSFDTWSPKLRDVYRVSLITKDGQPSITTQQPLSQFILEHNPDAISATRVLLAARGELDPLLSAGETQIYRNDILRVDSNFLTVFPYQVENGDPKTVLSAPNSIVITRDLKMALFGDKNPIGKTIQLNKQDLFTVTGVINMDSYRSHLSFGALIPLRSKARNQLDWNIARYGTYVALKQGYASKNHHETAAFNAALDGIPALTGQGLALGYTPVRDIHLHYAQKEGSRSSYDLVLICLLLAVLILVITVVNYINLTIATSINRYKEIYVRRVIGADTGMIFWGILSESLIHVVAAVLLAFLLIMPLAQGLGRLLDMDLLHWSSYSYIRFLGEIAFLILITVCLAGGYPAFVFSRYSAARLSKFGSTPQSERSWLRKFLLALQFTVSIFFVCVSLVIFTQVRYLLHMDYGFVPDQVFKYQASYGVYAHYNAFKHDLLDNPSVKSVSRCSNYPGDGLAFTQLPFTYKGESHNLDLVSVDYDYFSTLGVKFISGRDFNPAYPTDSSKGMIINEACARELAFDPVRSSFLVSPCGQDSSQRAKSILGVVGNYNSEGFQASVRPTVYVINSGCTNSMTSVLVKVSPGNLVGTTHYIEKTWNNYNNVLPIRPKTVQDEFLKYLITYQRMEKIFFISTMGLILISLLGIFSLASFELDQRWRELSIRKVLGATMYDLFRVLNMPLIYILLVANLVAVPLAWYFSKIWLNNFTYRVQMPVLVFSLTTAFSVLVSLVVANTRMSKLISLNPSQKLREN
ncbi:ABC transporter permease [Dinghuibacter silviterrae]|uniref:ABC-type antimicrobial peptide transport system permease subunit n=1 Tax=Dinghuibacter silviterrae TaxID=1539049 RepID=A0A4R8DSW8_9BACT|nr:ABC transporter permease [Dinghuibacter silviterrae]TDX00497.1 ABC-type antimicrobial peptide transport system permease subunit [Dinghuibacter silviterrae]